MRVSCRACQTGQARTMESHPQGVNDPPRPLLAQTKISFLKAPPRLANRSVGSRVGSAQLTVPTHLGQIDRVREEPPSHSRVTTDRARERSGTASRGVRRL